MSTGCDNLAYQIATRSTDLVMDCPIISQLQIALGANMSIVSSTKMDINISFTEFMCIIWSTMVVILKLEPGMNSLKIPTGRGNQKLWFKEGKTIIFVLETIDMFAPNAICSWKIIGQSFTKSVLLVAIWYARLSQPVDIARHQKHRLGEGLSNNLSTADCIGCKHVNSF
jgi:hypothetical protein